MNRAAIVDHLDDLGFTAYQSEAYVAAIRLGSATPRELVDESGVPQARIYDIVEDLSDLGLVEVREGSGSKRVIAVPPEVSLEGFKRRRVNDLATTVDEVIEGLETVHEPRRGDQGFVTTVDLEESAVRHVRQVVESADWWVSLALPLRTYEAVADEVAAALDRNVTVRLVLPAEADLGTAEFPPDLAVRRRGLADTLALADRDYGVSSSLSTRDASDTYIVTRDRNLVFLFQNFFEQFWPASETVQADTRQFPRRYLDPWRTIRDLLDRGLAADPTRYSVSATGFDNAARARGALEGPLVDFELSGPVEADYTTLLPVTASLFVDAGESIREVGGRKATEADIAADGIELRRS
jgi:sugar-specific transcriptional regulator TrmB